MSSPHCALIVFWQMWWAQSFLLSSLHTYTYIEVNTLTRAVFSRQLKKCIIPAEFIVKWHYALEVPSHGMEVQELRGHLKQRLHFPADPSLNGPQLPPLRVEWKYWKDSMYITLWDQSSACQSSQLKKILLPLWNRFLFSLIWFLI